MNDIGCRGKRAWIGIRSYGGRTLLRLMLCALLAAGVLIALLHGVPFATTATDKIAPAVWNTTVEGRINNVSSYSEKVYDFIVVMKETADLSPARALSSKAQQGYFVHEGLQAMAERSQAPLKACLDARGIPYRAFYIVNALHVTGNREVVLSLAARPDVARIVANPRVRMALPPLEIAQAEPEPSPQAPTAIEWNVSLVNAPEVWAMGYSGQGVVVAGQDTGYDWDHPALKHAYRGWSGTLVDHDYNWHDAVHSGGGVCGPDAAEPCDDHGHGTHTMGSIVGDDGDTRRIGVAPGARWIGCRNMNRGVGTPAMYIECFEFFLAPYGSGKTPAYGRPELAPDIINNSWSCPTSEGCDWDTLQAVVEAVRAAGIMVVASAGNSGSACSTVREPISLYDAAYTIGATDRYDAIASFSGRGPVTVDGSQRLKPDLVAPGVNVFSSYPGGGYGTLSGTSMSAPHVAGAIALLWSARLDLRGQLTQTENIFNATAVPRFSTQCGDAAATVPNNVYGWGRLDALAAVQAQLGRLHGTVSSAGEPLSGASVAATLNSTATWAITSDVQGQYAFWLVPGVYTVTITAPAHLAYISGELAVTAGQTTTLDIALDHCQLPEGLAFSVDPLAPYPGETITFAASIVDGTLPVGYTWTVTPGVDLKGTVVSYAYPARGIYTVSLTAFNCAGALTVQRPITVSAPKLEITPTVLGALLDAGERETHPLVLRNAGNRPLDWRYAVSPTVGWLDLRLEGSAAQPLLPQMTQTLWADFGTLELYTGTYTTTLAFLSDDPLNPVLALPVTMTVGCIPVSGTHIEISATHGLWVGHPVTFTGSVVTGTQPISYTWDFDDGDGAVGPSVSHIFPRATVARTYAVRLEARNKCTPQPDYAVREVTISARAVYLPLIIREQVQR